MAIEVEQGHQAIGKEPVHDLVGTVLVSLTPILLYLAICVKRLFETPEVMQ